jgi:hypothetical protein
MVNFVIFISVSFPFVDTLILYPHLPKVKQILLAGCQAVLAFTKK